MDPKKSDRFFFSDKKISCRTPMRRGLWDRKNMTENINADSPDVWEFMAPFFLSDALPYWYVCMVRCGQPAVFVGLCKLHTIDDHVLCHATVVVSGTDVFEAEESRRLHVIILWRVCSMYTQSVVLDNTVTHNTSRRTAAGRLIALLVHLWTTLASYSTWSSIVSDLHNHTNAALRPQRAMQTELSVHVRTG